jgi:hypothetical protein
MTLEKAESGKVSKRSPQVAPALAKRMSMWGVDLAISVARRWISLILERSAGMGMARAPGRLVGRALRAVQAAVQADALREVM